MSDQFTHYITNGLSRHSLARRSLGEGGSFLVRWLDRRQNIGLIAKIFHGHFFDVFERDGVHVVLKLFVVIKTKTVELVERAMVTERVVALIGDLLLADQ